MKSPKLRLAALILIVTVLAVGFFASPASTTKMREETVRFTVVKRTPQYVLAKWRQERVVLWKGNRYVVQDGVLRYVVVRITRRYAYLDRLAAGPASPATPATVNVRDFGANGDGVSNDHAAFSKALAAASAVGAVVYVPAGNWSFTTRLRIPDGVTIQGSGVGSWLNGPVTVGSNTTYRDLKIGADYNDTSIYGVSNVTFTNVRFHGGGGSGTKGSNPSTAHVVSIGSTWTGTGYSVSNVLFDGCTFERNMGVENSSKSLNYVGVSIKAGVASTDSKVEHVLFRGCSFLAGAPNFTVEMWQDYSQVCRVGMTDVSFEGCTFEAGECASIDYSGGTNASGAPSTGYAHVTGCTFKGNGAGTDPHWINDITVEKGAGYITVSDNTFYRGLGCAFRAEDNGGHNVFTGNVIDATDNAYNTGITRTLYLPYVMLDSSNNVATGNTITSTGPQAAAIEIAGDNNTVTDNIIHGGTVVATGSGNLTAPNYVD